MSAASADIAPTGAGQAVMARLDELAAFTDEPGRITRLYLSPSHRAAAAQVAAWMEAAGMATHVDAAGNIIGRLEGEHPGLPALLLGSHIDSIRDAGKYDGPLGVVAAIAAVDEIRRRGALLPFAIEVLAFGDEEGIRFPTTLLGSRAVAGTFDERSLAARDIEGSSVEEALRLFGCDPAAIPGAARRRGETLAYIEVHIEQGPVLERIGTPLGVVTAISGASRFDVTVYGRAGHAGTTPMDLRWDAISGASEMVLAAEAIAKAAENLVATVGTIAVPNGATNVIPGLVRFSLDLRAPVDADRAAAEMRIRAAFDAIAEQRRLSVSMVRYHDAAATPCDPALADGLAAAIAGLGLDAPRLASGAGHDGMAIASLCPIGMMFVRCKGGISHNPAESILAEDADLAVRALVDFILSFDPGRLQRPPIGSSS
ncbi:MAG: allantoate amidohydrolase [Bauldia sp.]|nr:allantoate amidohydrolase [Bauldia sp.]